MTAALETMTADPLMDAIGKQEKYNNETPLAVQMGHEQEKPIIEKVVEQKPEEKKAEQTTEEPAKKENADPLAKLETLPSEDEQKKQSRWMELKAAEKERNELREWRAKEEKRIKELEAKAWKDEEKKELEELRIERKAREVEKTPEWQQQIVVPYKQREDYIERAAKHYEINASQLWEALDIADPFARGEKLDEVLKGSVKEVPANVTATLSQVGTDLQVIYGEMTRKRAEAMELGKSLDAQKSQLTEKQQAEQKAQYDTAHQEVYDALGKKLPTIFADAEAAESVKNAVPAEDAKSRAYQAQAGELLPHVTKRLIEAEAKLRTYEKNDADRAAAKPNMQQTDVKLPTPKEQQEYKTLDEAMAAQARHNPLVG